MRKIVIAAGLVTMLLLTVPGGFAAPPSGSKVVNSGTIVIVFKDGHRQSFNLADIARVEFPTTDQAGAANAAGPSTGPSRGHFIGKWEAGDGNGGMFFITLEENGSAYRSIGNKPGKWVYINGEAHVTWNDGAQDAIRKVGSKYQKFAYHEGKSFTDEPDNVTDAHNTTPKAI